jgi:hypothetical protein
MDTAQNFKHQKSNFNQTSTFKPRYGTEVVLWSLEFDAFLTLEV